MNKNSSKNFRVNLYFYIIIFLFIVIFYRLIRLQIFQHENYLSEARDQYVYSSGDNFDRGEILFRDKNNKNQAAAQMSLEYNLALDPRTINTFYKKYSETEKKEKIEDLFNTLNGTFIDFNKKSEDKLSDTKEAEGGSKNLSTSSKKNILIKDDFYKKLQSDSAYEILSTQLPEELALKIISLHLKGIIINRRKARFYPENEIAAKVLGFVGFNQDNKNKTGLYGIEKYYADILNRDSGETSMNFFAEVFSDLSSVSISNDNNSDDKNGDKEGFNNISGNINLTIDIGAQRFLMETLKEVKDKWKSESVGGIIMDPNDGSILAMEELPTFNPNSYSKVENLSYYKNNLVSGVYEMGSIIKPLTMAAAIDSGSVKESTTYYDAGAVELNGFKVSNFDKQARGASTSMQTVLDKSLNVGIAFIVQKMGGEKLSQYFHQYGFGKETGIDLPGEVVGLVSNLDSGVVVDSVTAGFGQGIALTPIQTIRALAVLGNGGKLVNPHIVQSITKENGRIKNIIPDESIQVFKNSSTSEIISRMLVHVVDFGMKHKDPHYSVAAKTGTAQIPNPATGKYYEGKYLHSFFGYFPANKPKYIIFLYQVHPIGAEYASQTLKDSFFKLVNFLISYDEIPPDR